MEEVKLMKGNEAIAHAAVRYGVDGYFGYTITPQSEVLETLEALMPWETTGMVVLQAESEVAAINMVCVLYAHYIGEYQFDIFPLNWNLSSYNISICSHIPFQFMFI